MVITRRQQAIDLIDQYGVDSNEFLAWMISDYMGGGELLHAVKSYIQDEMGIDTDEEVE